MHFSADFLKTAAPWGRAKPMPKPKGYRPILNFENAKTSKGEKLGYRTGIIYFAPAEEAGKINMCPFSTEECRKDCLYTAGRGGFHKTKRQRIAKTLFYLDDREAFLESLRHDIRKLIRDAENRELIPAVRINGTSDLPKLALQMAKEFPDIQFYDYTKIPKPYKRTQPNYDVTFSYSGENKKETLDALRHGINVAVVFDIKKGEPLPETWMGYKVIDGDLTDLRFLDKEEGDEAVIVGLYAKGKARKDPDSKFVVKTQPPEYYVNLRKKLEKERIKKEQEAKKKPLVQINQTGKSAFSERKSNPMFDQFVRYKQAGVSR